MPRLMTRNLLTGHRSLKLCCSHCSNQQPSEYSYFDQTIFHQQEAVCVNALDPINGGCALQPVGGHCRAWFECANRHQVTCYQGTCRSSIGGVCKTTDDCFPPSKDWDCQESQCRIKHGGKCDRDVCVKDDVCDIPQGSDAGFCRRSIGGSCDSNDDCASEALRSYGDNTIISIPPMCENKKCVHGFGEACVSNHCSRKADLQDSTNVVCRLQMELPGVLEDLRKLPRGDVVERVEEWREYETDGSSAFGLTQKYCLPDAKDGVCESDDDCYPGRCEQNRCASVIGGFCSSLHPCISDLACELNRCYGRIYKSVTLWTKLTCE